MNFTSDFEFIKKLTDEQKILIVAAMLGGVLVTIISSCICYKLCCSNRNARGSEPPTSTPASSNCRNGRQHNVEMTPISSVAAAAGWSQDCPPPPYASALTAPKKR